MKSTTTSSSSDGGLYSVSSQIMTIGINYGHYMVTIFIGLPIRATLNQEILLVHVLQMEDGIPRKLFMSLSPWGRFFRGEDASFQVVWRTDLEVDLERTENYFVELLALYLRRIII